MFLLTVDLDASHLVLHDGRVDLTHVAAAVALLHLADVQVPSAVLVVGERDPGVVGHDAVLQGQDGLGVDLQPPDLREREGEEWMRGVSGWRRRV